MADATTKNEKLTHSKGGATTRDDRCDSGVPMIQGDASEPVGPEDALGSGLKRGDYSKVVGNLTHTATVPAPDHKPGEPSSPAVTLVHQNPLVAQRGDEKGVKGGTHPLSDEG